MHNKGWFNNTDETIHLYPCGFDSPIVVQHFCDYMDLLKREHKRMEGFVLNSNLKPRV